MNGSGNPRPTSARNGGLAVRRSVASSTVDAGAFAADERARDVEAVFGQQLVEVVAGHAARDARKLLRG